MEEVQVGRTRRQKRVAIGARVSAKVGDLIDEGGGRRHRIRINGTVISTEDSRKYKVLFDDGSTRDVYSNCLKIESSTASLPPDLRPANQASTEDAHDESETEHIPPEPAEDSDSDDQESEPDGDAGDTGGNDTRTVGALPTTAEVITGTRYEQAKSAALRKIDEKIGTTITEKHKSRNKTIIWTVIPGYTSTSPLSYHATDSHGLKYLEDLKEIPKNMILAKLFIELMFKDKNHVLELLSKMNTSIRNARDSKAKPFSPEEFLIGIGLLIGASEFEQQGVHCFFASSHVSGNLSQDYEFHSISPCPNFDRWMPFNRFKEFRRFLPSIWFNYDVEHTDPWWKFRNAVENFNEIRKVKLTNSDWALIDESMSAWRPRTTKLGGLPNLSHIPRKPEPLGTEFKSIADPHTGCLLGLEIQRGKEGMKDLQYNREYGNTCGCTLRLMDIAGCKGVKGDAWFGSVLNCVSLKLKGYDSVLQVKQNNALFPKTFVDQMLGDAPGGVAVFLKGSLDGVNLICTGYRYSRKTILYFVMSENAGTTTLGEPYEMKYTDTHGNILVRHVDRPDFISRYFRQSNIIDSHNQVRQAELSLEKKWHTRDPYFRLTTTLISITVTDSYRLAYYHKLIDAKRSDNDFDEQRTTSKKFAGYLAMQLLSCASSLLKEDDDIPPFGISRTLNVGGGLEFISDLTQPSVTFQSFQTLYDSNGHEHNLCKYPVKDTNGKKKCRLSRQCVICKENNIRHDVVYYCQECGMDHSFCSIDKHNNQRDCFRIHVSRIQRQSKRRRP